MVDKLQIRLGEKLVGTIASLGSERSAFTFDEAYVGDPQRPVLSLGFKSATGELLLEHATTRVKLLPFFSNLLPEGSLRSYLAERAGIKPMREFFLLAALGQDLPGAVTAVTADGEPLAVSEPDEFLEAGSKAGAGPALRFSLAGVQLKFSAVEKANGGLTIPARGVGGDWIVKLPSTTHAGVSENEYSMMTLARQVGIDAPPVELYSLDQIANLPEGVGRLTGAAYAIQRFDRPEPGEKIHIEDFAQVFSVYPDEKYERASYRNIAQVLWRETGETGVVEFVRRLVFNALIGNADMHLKNWSLIYRDGVTAELAPAYDFVSTIPYIPDDKAALKVANSKRWSDFGQDELAAMAAKAGLPERTVLRAAAETVQRFHDAWGAEQAHLPMHDNVREAVALQLSRMPLART
jgi:serine/threonine-protein kinase HipA